MDWMDEFSGDEQFTRLVCREDAAVDLTLLALEVARDFTPGLDFGPTLEWIDARGRELAPRLARASGDEGVLREIVHCLAVEQGVTGSNEAYDTPDGSCLNRVIETRRGIPLSLCLLYRAVAARQQIELCGVCSPGHFLLRYNTLLKPLFIDPFHAGRILPLDTVVEEMRKERTMSQREARQALNEGTVRAITLRMLNNFKAVTARNAMWRLCGRIQTRVLALRPGSYADRRDWGLIQLKAGRPGPALTMLEKCLRTCPAEERKMLKEQMDLARQQLATWN